MSDNPDQLSIALHLLRSGQLREAEQRCSQVVQTEPNNPDAWHMYGILTAQLGDNEKAIGYLLQALRIDPNNAAYSTNLGNMYQAADQLERAIDCYERSLQLAPDTAATWNSLGVAHRRAGNLNSSVQHLEQAIRLQADYAEAHFNLGITFRFKKQTQDAIRCLRRAVELRPNYANAIVSLAETMKDDGQFQDAVPLFQQLLTTQPNSAAAHNEIGVCLHEQGQVKESLAYYQRAVELAPQYAEAHNNLGTAWDDLGDAEAAIQSYQNALQHNPDLAVVHFNLGNALRQVKRWDDALEHYQRALAVDKDCISALSQLVHLKRKLCSWSGLRELSEQVVAAVEAGNKGVPPFTFVNLAETTAAQHLRCAELHMNGKRSVAACQQTNLGFSFSKQEKKRLTIGYVSADFRKHAMSSLFTELFELHNRDAFRVIGYSHGPDDGSPVRARIERSLDRCVDIREHSFADAARVIHEDQVDILVDLMGHQQHARNEIFALRPAPIQVNYLAYPGTTGADFMDYILVDEFCVPPDQREHYSEELAYLPGCYQVNDRKRQVSENTPSRESCGLPNEGFVFCCFNQTHKITPEVFAVWMRLLRSVDGSVLWLWSNVPEANENLRFEAELRGIDGDRLVFAEPVDLADHLARFRMADLALDTFPYNGHTITSDALWVGCPVLTMSGDTFPSRVAGSLLQAIGLAEWITYSLDDYEALALELANGNRISDLKKRLAAQRDTTALFDTPLFVQNLESAYRRMWESYVRT